MQIVAALFEGKNFAKLIDNHRIGCQRAPGFLVLTSQLPETLTATADSASSTRAFCSFIITQIKFIVMKFYQHTAVFIHTACYTAHLPRASLTDLTMDVPLQSASHWVSTALLRSTPQAL